MKGKADIKTIGAFLYAKKYVILNGYSEEIQWQESLNFYYLTQKNFIKEAAWVILNSGMKESLIRKLFGSISECFFNWECSTIIKNRRKCFTKSLKIFNHPGKISAILTIAEDVYVKGIEKIKSEIIEKGINRILEYPFMGNATSYHFAKNVGLDFAKPDRHLNRIASMAGYKCPQEMCQKVANEIGEKISVVDLIFWRFATLDKNYLRIFAYA